MEALVWNEVEAQSALRSLRKFAEKPENVYRPEPGLKSGPGVKGPGDDKRFRRSIGFRELHDPALPNALRVVFTITVSDGIEWRHLSVSAKRGDPPFHMVQQLVLPALGFRGGLKDCVVNRQEQADFRPFIVAQPLRPAAA